MINMKSISNVNKQNFYLIQEEIEGVKLSIIIKRIYLNLQAKLVFFQFKYDNQKIYYILNSFGNFKIQNQSNQLSYLESLFLKVTQIIL